MTVGITGVAPDAVSGPRPDHPGGPAALDNVTDVSDVSDVSDVTAVAVRDLYQTQRRRRT